MSGHSAELLALGCAGDEDAARELFDRYVHRLVPLVNKFIGPKLQARFDPEDVVQSVFRSVFRRAANDEYLLQRSGDLWRLLASITVNKARKRVERELAQKRTPAREVPHNSAIDLLAAGPSDRDAEQLIEDVLALAQRLKPPERQILELRLASESHAAIAEAVGCSEATVRRALRRIRDLLDKGRQEE